MWFGLLLLHTVSHSFTFQPPTDLSTLYMAPCRLMTLCKKVQLEIDVYMSRKEGASKKKKKKNAAAAGDSKEPAAAGDSKEGMMSEAVVKEQVDILKNNFVDILYSLYNTHLPEDRRLLVSCPSPCPCPLPLLPFSVHRSFSSSSSSSGCGLPLLLVFVVLYAGGVFVNDAFTGNTPSMRACLCAIT